MIRKLAFLVFGVFLTLCASAIFSSLPLEIAKPDMGVPFIIYGVFFLSPAEGLLAAVLFWASARKSFPAHRRAPPSSPASASSCHASF